MTKLIVAMQESILEIESSKSGWKTRENLKGSQPQCIAVDLSNPSRVYCGTYRKGLWKTDDSGKTWVNIGKEVISSSNIMSVAVSNYNLQRKNDNGEFNTVYVGTEPTELYRSDDGGESWNKMNSLNNLKSSTSWSFPPRPWTSHVRWIEPDKNRPSYVYAAIEAGALVQSRDGGTTWIDRVEGGPYDTHTLASHKKMPGQLYSAAGDGYFESYDYGLTWKRLVAGLDDYDYLLGLAVDSGDPKTVVVSASQGAYHAHSRNDPNSLVYVRTSLTDDNSAKEWKVVTGLPEARGTIISIIAANPKVAGEFYALNNRGIFCSSDSGSSWKIIDDLQWPREYISQHPFALAVEHK
jgi:photosystem II stability/assembly factor-like uncharacterized protein